MTKKLLLLLLLLPFMVEAQELTRDEYLKGTRGKPTWIPANNNAIAPDYVAQQVWKFNKTQNKWALETDTNVIKIYLKTGINGKDGLVGPVGPQGPKGDQGERGLQGIQGFKGDTGETGPQGIAGVAGPQGIQGVKGDKGDTGPQGPMGPQGPAGGGSGGSLPFIIISTNGNDDWATLQAGVDKAYTTHQPIWVVSNLIYDKDVVVPKDIQNFFVYGCGNKWIAKSNKTFNFLTSPVPASANEAVSVYTFRNIKIMDVQFIGYGQKQNGINLYASENAKYERCWFYDCKVGLDLVFALGTVIDNCEFINCEVGCYVRSGVNIIPNAETYNSASNKCIFTKPRCCGAGNNTSIYGIAVFDATGTAVYDPTWEGATFTIAAYYHNSTSNTSSGMVMIRPHCEVDRPCGKAVMFIRSNGMSHFIDCPIMDKDGAMVAVESSGGYVQVKISNIGTNRVVFRAGQKLFKTVSGTSWYFDYVDDPFSAANIIAQFDQPVSEGIGPNKFVLERTTRDRGYYMPSK